MGGWDHTASLVRDLQRFPRPTEGQKVPTQAGLEQHVQKTLFPGLGFDTFHGQRCDTPSSGAWKVSCEIQWPNFRPWVSMSKQQ